MIEFVEMSQVELAVLTPRSSSKEVWFLLQNLERNLENMKTLLVKLVSVSDEISINFERNFNKFSMKFK